MENRNERDPIDMNDRGQTTHEAGGDPFELKDVGAFSASLTVEFKAWLAAQRDYHTVVASERVARLSAGFLGGFIIWVLAACALAFVSLAGAIWIGDRLGDTALGFFTMGGIYVVLMLVFALVWRRWYRDRSMLRVFNALYHG